MEMADTEAERVKEEEPPTSTTEAGEGDAEPKVEKKKPPPVPAHKPPPSPTVSSSIRLHLHGGSLPRTKDSSGAPKEPQRIDFENRDPHYQSELVRIQFEDVFAEPEGTRSYDAIWGTSTKVFNTTKIWCYRLLSAVFAVPCAFCWGLHFACAIFDYIWTVQPLIRSLTIAIKPIGVLWKVCISSFLDPVFESVGRIFSNFVVSFKKE